MQLCPTHQQLPNQRIARLCESHSRAMIIMERHLNTRVLEHQLRDARLELDRIRVYLQTKKFHKDDYVYITTDLMPKLEALHRILMEK